MRKRRSICASVLVVLSTTALAQGTTKKSESTTGTVSGSVTCADTNAPARFAVVTLERMPEEVSASGKKEKEEAGMNPTATTDMEGRFFLDKVPAGHYYAVGKLAGYLNPLAQFSEQQLQKMSDETRKELAKAVPIVSVGANQGAAVSLRLEHASELSGTVLYDDGSPAVSLEVKLLHKDKDGKLVDLKMGVVNGWGLSGSTSTTDDRGRYRMIGVPSGDYTVSASLPTQTFSLAGLFGDESLTVVGQEGGGLSIYYGDTFRKKDAKIAKVGDGDQVGGLDITIAGNGLHSIRGTAVAKLDGHPVSRAHVELLYADDRELVRTEEIGRENEHEDGSFEFSYVPAGQYILRLVDAIDIEKIERHEFNSNFTDEKLIRRYDVAELPVTVQGDMNGIELAAPDIAANKVPAQ
jgi:hypothetical protein